MNIKTISPITFVTYLSFHSAMASSSQDELTACMKDETWTEEKCAVLDKSEGFEVFSEQGKIKWNAVATWIISVNGYAIQLNYRGSGPSKDSAFLSAKQDCMNLEIPMRRPACNSEASVAFTRTEVVDKAWSKWTNIGASPGNPCPKGLNRGNEIGQSYRIVDFIIPQTKHKFECVKTFETIYETRN